MRSMKNYKNRFPFIIGTPSYILPIEEDNLIANVMFLKDSFDMVQLLYFGRDHLDEVMSPRIVNELDAIRRGSGISYTVHLPVDLDLLNPSMESVRGSIGVVDRILSRTERLAVEGYILHVDAMGTERPDAAPAGGTVRLFQDALTGIAERFGDAAKNIFIENTGYDLADYKSIIADTPFGVCMDIGHLIRQERDIQVFLDAFGARIAQAHVHGVSEGRDHRSLAEMEPAVLQHVIRIVQGLGVPVVVEVYNYDDLSSSMDRMESFIE